MFSDERVCKQKIVQEISVTSVLCSLVVSEWVRLSMYLMKFDKVFLRNLRRESFQDYDAIIFVVDSADRYSFDETDSERWNFLR